MASPQGPQLSPNASTLATEGPSPFRIGYVLSAKKARSFLRQELIDACRERNVLFVPIDRSKKLTEGQESFNAILHKDSNPEWMDQLEEYKALHPNCILIDDPRKILPLHNRLSMLECVDPSLLSALRESCPSTVLKVPSSISVREGDDAQSAMQEGSMNFPLVVKPLLADGSADSHKMYLALNQTGLSRLTPPFIIQRFINHGGIIFKVYVVGKSAICSPRKSLPDCCEEDLEDPKGIVFFSQVSNLPTCQPNIIRTGSLRTAKADPEVDLAAVALPEDDFVQRLSSLLRVRLNLTLFNYDLIQDTETGEYFIVDINYFPGFAKMPNYLHVLSDYFAGLQD